MEEKQYFEKCYSIYYSSGYDPTQAQTYCTKPTGGKYGQLATFASMAEYSVVTSLFVNEPHGTTSPNWRWMYIGLKTGSPYTWADPHNVCGAETLSGVPTGPSTCSGSWTENVGTSGSYVMLKTSWCDWESGNTAIYWFFCEYGMLDFSFWFVLYIVEYLDTRVAPKVRKLFNKIKHWFC